MSKVFIVGADYQIERMFKKFGWEVVDNMEEADLIQFTGGADVTPSLYGQENVGSYNDIFRDRREAIIFKAAEGLEKKMAGICRGGQFLNVMCGGTMWQDVDNHLGNHFAYDAQTGAEIFVTSTHHQMMIPGLGGEIVMYALLARNKTKGGREGEQRTIRFTGEGERDVEAVMYPERGCFCFQPHPEYSSAEGLDKHYFDYIEEFFGFTSMIKD